mmetsp:Transcript_24902/g.36723  ORF Transcript_24902/g.36723 Transcript_24902/m.36723 type:complete len:328 (+) Transcript_24902:46-1029(+)|eukprot:CAMPEP_0185033882 /NCGR_PEP_ID=MMETSP1103-20130426/23277_1 /TAXON_ID=36769 /ORGANISM="Paraphysomonas bandaiensis, Strain Caron Lab Isolate" /LENGTH=327 /DNA_ID=CAMNT_0027570313 /DNA_START=36 /DNA_END=1019 /DNA_ORIENTATION=-
MSQAFEECVIPGCIAPRRSLNPYCSEYHDSYDSSRSIAKSKGLYLVQGVWGPPWPAWMECFCPNSADDWADFLSRPKSPEIISEHIEEEICDNSMCSIDSRHGPVQVKEELEQQHSSKNSGEGCSNRESCSSVVMVAPTSVAPDLGQKDIGSDYEELEQQLNKNSSDERRSNCEPCSSAVMIDSTSVTQDRGQEDIESDFSDSPVVLKSPVMFSVDEDVPRAPTRVLELHESNSPKRANRFRKELLGYSTGSKRGSLSLTSVSAKKSDRHKRKAVTSSDSEWIGRNVPGKHVKGARLADTPLLLVHKYGRKNNVRQSSIYESFRKIK